MQRWLFFWGLVMSWVAGAAGMASALTLEADSCKPSCQLQITWTNNLTWDGAGYPGDQRYDVNPGQDRVIAGGKSASLNYVERQGMSSEAVLPADCPFGPGVTAAIQVAGPLRWRQKVDYPVGHTDLGNWPGGEPPVAVPTPDITSLIFPGSLQQYGMDFSPSLDHLAQNDPALPIPGGGFWLLASGLVGLVGMSKKFIF